MQPSATDNVRIVESSGLEGGKKSSGASGNDTKQQSDQQDSQLQPALPETEAVADTKLSTTDHEKLRSGLAEIAVDRIQFSPNSTELTAESKTILDLLSELLGKYQSAIIEVGGHTDSQGSENYNKKLSQQRADSVVHYLNQQRCAEDTT